MEPSYMVLSIYHPPSKKARYGRLSNKTADYHRHILRLPIFVKKGFKKMKMFFSRKNTFFIIFSTFSNFQNFKIFCQIFSRKDIFME